MTDNKSAFAVNQYDENVRKVIPFHDEIFEQIFSMIRAYCGDRPLAVPDTGCGTGTLGKMALERLNLTELVLSDPSEKMLAGSKSESTLDFYKRAGCNSAGKTAFIQWL